ncbi:hypothetical protein ACGGAQ_09185 [Micromonospora sp. NPDC047557]|uniref:hypothetical protein n=1 Tax=Micromonospora sp. NPDC047557 TaxID=3364250 RepID=UPI003723DD34
MKPVVVLLVTLATLLIVAFIFVSWRDRKRHSSPEDSAAAGDARSTQERYAAERHAVQGEVWRRGQNPPST